MKSCGVIAYTNTKMLLVKSRDSFAFMNFMRGNRFDINRLTGCEIERLKNNNFERVYQDYNCFRSSSQYHHNTAKNSWTKHIDKIRTITNYNPNEHETWGIPKGRPNPGESDVETASREFAEETGIQVYVDKHHYTDCNIIGDDGKPYSYRLFYARFKHTVRPKYKYFRGILRPKCISDETLDFKWFHFDHARRILGENDFTKSIFENLF